MNPIALVLIIIGIVLLLFGVSSLTKSNKTKGLVLTLVGVFLIAFPFVASYLITR